MGETADKAAKISLPFHTFFKFSKPPQDEGDDVIVEGYASTEAMDDDGEVVDVAAIRDAWPAYMEWANLRQMHSGIAAGTVLEGEEREGGWWIKAKVSAKDSVDLVRKGVLKGFSIGGRKILKIGNRIKSIVLNEISLVDRPANTDCAFSFGKMSDDNLSTTLEIGDFNLTICRKSSKGADNNIADQSLIHGRGGVTAPTTGQSAKPGNSAHVTEKSPMKTELFQKFVAATVALQAATDLTDGEKSFLETVAKGANMTDAQRAELAKACNCGKTADHKAAMQKCIDTMKSAGCDDGVIANFAKEAGMEYTAAAKSDVTKGATLPPTAPDLTKYAKLDQVVTPEQFNQLTKRLTLLTKFVSALPVQPREDWAAEFVTKADDTTGNSALSKILANV